MAEQLRVLDSAFVEVEREGLPMHVAGLAVLDPGARPGGAIRPAELRRRLRSRLRSLPRLTARLEQAPFGLRRPVWVPDGAFDVDRHLEHFTLGPGAGWPELLQLAGELHSRLLPRDRPLWRLSLIDGLPAGRQALLTTTHHAITDGMASVELTQAVFDTQSRSGAAPARASSWVPDGGTSGLTRALQAAAGAARYLAGGPVATGGPFNGSVGPRRALATVDLHLEDALRIKRRLGGTVDDVVLTAVALALGAHLRARGERTDGRRLRVLVPISTLKGAGGLGNHVTATFLDLPLWLPPTPCLHAIAAAKALSRTWHEPLGLHAVLDATGLAPFALVSPVTRLLAMLPFANLIVSDIPGPPEALSLLGARMVGAYPLMPLSASVGLAIAVVTIAGQMGVGITTDPDLVGDGDELAREVGAAFESLLAAAQQGAAVKP